MPALDYLERYCYQWHDVKASEDATTLITEKCRRMIISWEARALELHQMGLGRCDAILAGEEFAPACKHTWRLGFLYDGLCERHPEWRLPPRSEIKHSGERQLKQLTLANGSICSSANGQAVKLQGEGARIFTLEEAAQYRYLGRMVQQAQTLLMGKSKAGTIVNLITNTPAENAPGTYQWDKLIKGWDAELGR